MLLEFVETHREPIIARTQQRVSSREWPAVSAEELNRGVPMFLTQLADTLRLESIDRPSGDVGIESTAAVHGGALRTSGFSVSQVVQDYGEICQAIADVAIEERAAISVPEFRTLNHCLDVAIAGAVTEYARVTAAERTTGETERLGEIAHELRNNLSSALLAYGALKRGTVGINGTTGAILGRSLLALREVVDRSLTEVRLSSGKARKERLSARVLIDEAAEAAALDAGTRAVRFCAEPIPEGAAVIGDPQLLASAIMNLLQNALKFAPAGGQVTLRSTIDGGDLVIEVQDECGGLPAELLHPGHAFGPQLGTDRSGLGLGLSIVRKAITAHGGTVTNRNEGAGCVFAIRIPLAAASDSSTA